MGGMRGFPMLPMANGRSVFCFYRIKWRVGLQVSLCLGRTETRGDHLDDDCGRGAKSIQQGHHFKIECLGNHIALVLRFYETHLMLQYEQSTSGILLWVLAKYRVQ